MKLAWSNRLALLICVALIAVTNGVALVGVAYNRSGTPDSTLRLTERELSIDDWYRRDSDNGGNDLRLLWRVRHASPGSPLGSYKWNRGIDWLSRDELIALGFNVSHPLDADDASRYYDHGLSREVLLVLELDGPAYQAVLAKARERLKIQNRLLTTTPDNKELQERAKRASTDLDAEIQSASRLFVVDVGTEASLLRQRHPDRSRYAIVRAQLSLSVIGARPNYRLIANVDELSVEQIALAHTYRPIVEPLMDKNRSFYNRYEGMPRYEATVNFGHRLEPWIAALSRITAAKP